MRRITTAGLVLIAGLARAFGDSVSVDVAAPLTSFYSISYEKRLTDAAGLRVDLAAAPALDTAGLRAFDGGLAFRFYWPGMRLFFMEGSGGYLGLFGRYADEAGLTYSFVEHFAWAGAAVGFAWAPFGAAGLLLEPSIGCKYLVGFPVSEVTSSSGTSLASIPGGLDAFPALRLAFGLGWKF